jgi:hypothetical protein
LCEQVEIVAEKIDGERMKERLATAAALLARDTVDGQIVPWFDLFPGTAVMDESDGVRRCPRCLWEILGNSCANCDERFSDADQSLDEGASDVKFWLTLSRKRRVF